MTSDVTMQNYLAEVTEALLAGRDIQRVRDRYSIPREEAQELTQLIQQIDRQMTMVEPTPQFARRLKADLLGEPAPQPGVLRKIRKLPARVQMAAIAALAGGFMLILQRRLIGEDTPTGSESAVREQT